MAHDSHCRIQARPLLLLPQAVDDYVGGNNLVRFIDAFGGGVSRGLRRRRRAVRGMRRAIC
jgi:hypothetical protein